MCRTSLLYRLRLDENERTAREPQGQMSHEFVAAVEKVLNVAPTNAARGTSR